MTLQTIICPDCGYGYLSHVAGLPCPRCYGAALVAAAYGAPPVPAPYRSFTCKTCGGTHACTTQQAQEPPCPHCNPPAPPPQPAPVVRTPAKDAPWLRRII